MFLYVLTPDKRHSNNLSTFVIIVISQHLIIHQYSYVFDLAKFHCTFFMITNLDLFLKRLRLYIKCGIGELDRRGNHIQLYIDSW